MGFVTTSGVNFMLDGRVWVPIGAAVYGYYGSNAAYLNRVQAAQDMGLNILRYVNYLQTGTFPNLYDPDPDSEFNEAIWARIDYGLDQARQAGIKILLDLSDIMGIGSAREYEFGDVDMLALYEEFVEWLAMRENTVNGRLYKDDDTIAIFAIVGEVGQIGPVGNTLNYDTYHAIAGYMKVAGFQQLIHAGGQKPEQNVDASYGHLNYSAGDYLSSPNIDCISVHPYYTFQNMADLHPEQQSYSIAKGKPWFMEEFGYSKVDREKRRDIRRTFQLGFNYGCAGALIWNLDENGTDGYGFTGFGVSALIRTPESSLMLKSMAAAGGYSPRNIAF